MSTPLPPAATRRTRLLAAGRILVPVGFLMLLWRFTPLALLLWPDTLRGLAEAAGPIWGPAGTVLVFVALGLLLCPANVLIAATALAFGAWPGAAYAFAGVLCSATATFGVGRAVGPKPLSDVFGPRLLPITGRIQRNGVLAVVLVRITPVAPFGLVNLLGGAIGVRYADFIIGTAVGVLPVLTLMTALGDQLWQVLRNPSALHLLMLAGVLLLWGGLAWGVQRLASRWRRN